MQPPSLLKKEAFTPAIIKNDNMTPPIIIKGARQHNLKSIDLRLEKNVLISLCGPSGAGKSSLAFNTLYAESRRRFLDCLTPQARQNIDQPDKPLVDSISGLPPALLLEQKSSSYGPRALLGTLTDITDYLRILYSVTGLPHDPSTGQPLTRQTSENVIEKLLSLPTGTRLTLLAPIADSVWTAGISSALGDFQRQGFLRLVWNDQMEDIEDLCRPGKIEEPKSAFLVIDRIILKGQTSLSRLSDSLQIALKVNSHKILAKIKPPDSEKSEDIYFHFKYINPETGFVAPDLTIKHFSFNSPTGACIKCNGLGYVKDKKNHHQTCPQCNGERLNPVSLAVTITVNGEKKNIAELTSLSISDLLPLIGKIQIPGEFQQACEPVLAEIHKKLSFLMDLGMGYLTLDRQVNSLSGGEVQRARLASQLGGGLSGVLYILDEPTAGLHPADIHQLQKAIFRLKNMGNTILVVEHDKQILANSDYLVDMGPEAGEKGGFIMAQGTPKQLMQNPASITGPWLSGEKRMPIPPPPKNVKDYLILEGACAHNLKNVTLKLPLGALTCIAGPSGSGKSSLVMDCLVPALQTRKKYQKKYYSTLRNGDKFSRIVVIDQSPIGNSPKSTPATASGLLTTLRSLFAELPLSRQRGYTAARFSTSSKEGRCEHCRGMGYVEVDMSFMGDVIVPCKICQGKRYNRETLEITWRGKSIADILALTVSEALMLFNAIPKINAILVCMEQLGLGYMSLDRPANHLSGGEAQRIILATELSRIPQAAYSQNRFFMPSPALLVLDEPTRGLHSREVSMLLSSLFKLRNAGHTILCIEHNLDIIAASDYLIDMGPGSGENGGEITYQGHPDNISSHPDSPTAPWLIKSQL